MESRINILNYFYYYRNSSNCAHVKYWDCIWCTLRTNKIPLINNSIFDGTSINMYMILVNKISRELTVSDEELLWQICVIIAVYSEHTIWVHNYCIYLLKITQTLLNQLNNVNIYSQSINHRQIYFLRRVCNWIIIFFQGANIQKILSKYCRQQYIDLVRWVSSDFRWILECNWSQYHYSFNFVLLHDFWNFK